MTQGLGRAGPVIGALAGDPTLRGLTRALSFGLLGVQSGQAKLEDLQRALTMSADTDRPGAGRAAGEFFLACAVERASLPRRASFATSSKSCRCSTFPPCSRARRASDAIRKAAADLKLGPDYQARVRLTGPVAMADDEFGTLQEGAVVNVRRHDHHRAGDPVAGVAFAAHHPRRVPQSLRRLRGDRRARLDDGGRAQPDLDGIRGAVRRSRRRFRHSVRRPLPVRAFQARRSAFGAGQHGREGRRAADARRGRGRGRLPVVLSRPTTAACPSSARSPASAC